MQTKTETQVLALSHISEVRDYLAIYASLLITHLENAPVVINQWQSQIDKALTVYEEYVMKAPEDESFDNFNALYNTIKHALVPKDMNNAEQYVLALEKYEELIREIIMMSPQAFNVIDFKPDSN